MQQETVKIKCNDPLSPSYYRMAVACSPAFEAAVPGQFVMVQPAGQAAPLLRRPFSIHRLIRRDSAVIGMEILYRVVGKATQRLSECRKGDDLALLGPLGRGFRIPAGSRRLFIVAGGIGVAPMLFLAETLNASGLDPAACLVFLGGRTRQDLLCKSEFRQLGMPLFLTTDDGSAGDMCLVTTALEDAIRDRPPELICACGPHGMLSCVAGLAETHRIACQVSVETVMACGMGACLGCAIEPRQAKEKYLHACLDGPVFDAGQLNL
jgi:dihydroorotate dehydrogenase electron transfer subunit